MTEPSTERLQLTEGQRRHLEVSLGQILVELEEAVLWFGRWPLPADIQATTLRDLDAVASGIRAMANRLGVSPAQVRPDSRQRLEALANHWWSTALDCRSSVLRRYGDLDPGTAPRLDPLVEKLALALFRVGRPSDDDPPDEHGDPLPSGDPPDSEPTGG